MWACPAFDIVPWSSTLEHWISERPQPRRRSGINNPVYARHLFNDSLVTNSVRADCKSNPNCSFSFLFLTISCIFETGFTYGWQDNVHKFFCHIKWFSYYAVVGWCLEPFTNPTISHLACQFDVHPFYMLWTKCRRAIAFLTQHLSLSSYGCNHVIRNTLPFVARQDCSRRDKWYLTSWCCIPTIWT